MTRLKRAVRYLRDWPDYELKFENVQKPEVVVVYTDADWAGDQGTRRSTSGGVACCGPSVQQRSVEQLCS